MNTSDILSIYSGGQLLSYSGIEGKTDFNKALVCRTTFSTAGIEIKNPENYLIHIFDELPDSCFLGNDFFIFQKGKKKIEGLFLDTYTLCIRGKIDLVRQNTSLTFYSDNELCLISSKKKISQNTKSLLNEWDALIDKREAWIRQALKKINPGKKYTGVAAKALAIMKNQVYSPEGKITHTWTTPDKWPHRKMWLWDSVFHAIGWRHIDRSAARDIITAVIDTIQTNGFLSHWSSPAESSEMTQPPLLAFGVRLMLQDQDNPTAEELSWIKSVYHKLISHLTWNEENRDTNNNGLLEWFIEGDPFCRSGESGMDNSPRFDKAVRLDAADFNSFMSQEWESMSKLASILGKESEKELFLEKHNQYNILINKYLWDHTAGFYYDYLSQNNSLSNVMASSGFLPLICGAPDNKQAALLVRQLKNSESFATDLPVPSIAKCDTDHYTKDMWRGPVWININWLIIQGLKRYGYVNEAREIEEKSIAAINKYYLEFGTLFEYYDDRNECSPPQLLRKGKHIPNSYHQVLFDYGWTATLLIDMLKTRSEKEHLLP